MISGEKIIVFGASDNGLSACRYLSRYNQVLFMCDNNSKKWNSNIGGYNVVSPDKIIEYKEAVVVIALVKRYHEVFQQLSDMGVHEIWHYVEFNNLVLGSCEQRLRLVPDSFPFVLNNNEIDLIKKQKKTDNFGKKKEALIIANYFPPIGGSGVQRPLKFVKYLKNYGYDTVVVTKGNCEKVLAMDYSLLDEIKATEIIRLQESPEYPEEITNDELEILNELLGSLGMDKTWIEKYSDYLKTHWETLPDNDVVWVLYCINNISHFIDLNSVSVVYTTIGPYSTALIGAYLKLKYGIKWVLDYRDPWTLDDYNMQTFYEFRIERREFEKVLEKNILKLADFVIGASEEYCSEFKELYTEIRTKCITNGYDEEDFIDVIGEDYYDKQIFNIVYAGYLYPSYDVELVSRIVNELITEKKINGKKIQLIFYGSDPCIKSFSADADIYNIVRYGGYVQHSESIRKLYSADILLLFGSLGEKVYSGYNGKVFEYMRVGKPILCISNPKGVQNDLIRRYGNSLVAAPSEKEKIKYYILSKYNEWKFGTNSYIQEPNDFVKSFSRTSLTCQLAQVFDEVIFAND